MRELIGVGGGCVAGLGCSAALRAAASLCALMVPGGNPVAKWGWGLSTRAPPLSPPFAGTPSSPLAALPPAPADPLSG